MRRMVIVLVVLALLVAFTTALMAAPLARPLFRPMPWRAISTFAFTVQTTDASWVITKEIWGWNGVGFVRLVSIPTGRELHQPAFSPDGRFIAYAERLNGDLNIWVKDLRSGRSWKVTFGTEDAEPAWSPDGTKLTFKQGPWPAKVVTIDVTNLTQPGKPVRVSAAPEWADEGHPTWGDGSIAWEVDLTDSGQTQIWKKILATGEITPEVQDAESDATEPALLGTRLAYTLMHTQVYFKDLGETGLGTPLPIPGTLPAWTPDGSGIYFSSTETNPADGTSKTGIVFASLDPDGISGVSWLTPQFNLASEPTAAFSRDVGNHRYLPKRGS